MPTLSAHPGVDAAIDGRGVETVDFYGVETVDLCGAVSVVIPALNEVLSIGAVLQQVPPCHELIVVDGGSVDGTVELILRDFPSVRIVHQEGSGKGDALARGFEQCTGELIVMLDADGSTDPREIPAFVAALRAGADLAKGSRYLPGGGSCDLTRFRSVGNRIFSGLVNLFFGTRYTDLCYGYVAFRRDCLDHLMPDCDGFEVETFLGIRAATAGLLVAEVPSYEHDRLGGESKLRPFRDGYRILRVIFRERLSQTARALDTLARTSPS